LQETGQAGRDDAAPAGLCEQVTALGHAEPGTRWTPFHGGRSNRAWRVVAAQGDVVVKLYATGRENPLFPNDPAAERACLARLAGTGIAPEPLASGTVPEGAWLIYRHVAGGEWTSGAASVARRLSLLHETPPPPGLRPRPGGSQALAAETLRLLAQCPDTAEKARVAAARPTGAEVPPADGAAFLHGDPVPGNLIVTGDGLVLIDWQCPALGDPAEDLGIFLSPAMQMLYRGTPLTEAEEAAFLAAADPPAAARYRSLAPWFHWRMAAYCLWRGAASCPAEGAAMAAELAALARY
jgi:aminoglycoside phosphotransferase (APT) family kinase protein